MADWKQYLSVINPSASSGTYTIQINTYDSAPPITFVGVATGSAGDDEITCARSINQCLTSFLNASGISYESPSFPEMNVNDPNFPQGQPNFSNEAPAATFNITQTDNVLCIWSQAQFRITVLSNTLNPDIYIDTDPYFVTFNDVNLISPVLGVDLTDNNEVPLSHAQIVRLIAIASSRIVRLINNYIVLSTYIHDEIGNEVGTLRLRNGPIVDWDMPQIRRPYIIGITSILITKSPVAYQVDRQLKLVNYRFTNQLIEISEPFSQFNEVHMSYRAGWLNIPSIVKEKTVQLMGIALEDFNIKNLSGGSGKIEFFRPVETMQWMALELREYNQSLS